MRWNLAIAGVILVCAACVATLPTEAAERPRDSSTVWLGVLIDDESLDGGIQLVAVVPGGPAERAGLESGDVLLEADGRALVRSEDLERALSRSSPGDSVVLQLLRGGRPLDRVVELAPPREVAWSAPHGSVASGAAREREASRAQRATAAPTATVAYGFTVAEVTPDLRVYYGAPPEAGVLVTGVRPGRTAHRAGLRVGDVLVELGPVRVHRVADVGDALETWRHGGRSVTVRVVRDSLERAVRFDAPGADAASGENREAREASAAFETLERSIEQEIDRLSSRISELERRLKRLREDRAAGDP